MFLTSFSSKEVVPDAHIGIPFTLIGLGIASSLATLAIAAHS